MNRKEYWTLSKTERPKKYYNLIQKKLKEWKITNSITTRCHVHHIDDREDAVIFNEQFYERWGFDENDEFVDGQYVKFMTASEHCKYHATHRSKETLTKLSNSLKGHKVSEETRQKLSESHKGKQTWCKGTHLSDETKQSISDSVKRYWKDKERRHSDETRKKISELRKGMKMSTEAITKSSNTHKLLMVTVKILYNEHKNNGGELSWNEFQKYLKETSNGCTNDIT